MGASSSKPSSSGGGSGQGSTPLGRLSTTFVRTNQTQKEQFFMIKDNFTTLDGVQQALRDAGLESSQLIFGVDFTKSNEWSGKHSFQGRSLHDVTSGTPNPYETALSILARTMRSFDDDNQIPCYGFGDSTTGDRAVFSFYEGGRSCNGLEEALWRYRSIAPHVRMAGPTSFAPLILEAVEVVRQNHMQYHILVIIADGQVTRSVDLPPGHLSAQEHHTVQAIQYASNFPLSIIMVGVGDGPWDLMNHFDDTIPNRRFDNFQFVEFNSALRGHGGDPQAQEAQFAMRALMEIPFQFRAVQELRLVGAAPPGQSPHYTTPRPPPPEVVAADRLVAAGGGGPQAGGAGQGVAYPEPPRAAAAPAAPAAPAPATSAASSATPPGGSAAEGPPPMFMCPITTEMMTDPVMAADGYTYERSAIETWLRGHDTSPMSNANLEHKHLIPNHQLRSAIKEHLGE